MSRLSGKVLGLWLVLGAATSSSSLAGVLEEWQVTTHPGVDESPDWTPDREWISYDHLTDTDYDIYKIPIMGGTPEPVITGEGSQGAGKWSPDGEKLAFISNHASQGNFDIYMTPAEGGAWTRLTNHPGYDSWPDWSPSNDLIVFGTDRNDNGDIYSVPADGSAAPTPLIASPWYEGFPNWQGSKIVFSSDRAGTGFVHIWTYDVDSETYEQITSGDFYDWHPKYRPQGDWFTFQRYAGSHFNICVTPVDGSGEPTQVTFWTGAPPNDLNKHDSQPEWSLDGLSIAYQTSRSGNLDIWAIDFDLPVAVPSTPTEDLVVLGQNQPNPFNPSTTIVVRLDEAVSDAYLEIFGTEGRRVRSVPFESGANSQLSITWDGLDDDGRELPSGTYFYRVRYAGGFTDARKSVLLK